MYIAPCDRTVLWSDEMRQLKENYRKRFGKPFAPFNYETFSRKGEKSAAEVYMDAIKEALR